MATLGIKEAFLRYGAALRNIQWSVSSWAPGGALVVSLWDHHSRKGPPGTLEFADSTDRWKGPGSSEFRQNVGRAYEEHLPVKLVIVRAEDPERVDSGDDASKIMKFFSVREDLVGKVVEWDGTNYVIQFCKA